jgi:hypothetical protein
VPPRRKHRHGRATLAPCRSIDWCPDCPYREFARPSGPAAIPQAHIVLVGEAPGADEITKGLPFVGRGRHRSAVARPRQGRTARAGRLRGQPRSPAARTGRTGRRIASRPGTPSLPVIDDWRERSDVPAAVIVAPRGDRRRSPHWAAGVSPVTKEHGAELLTGWGRVVPDASPRLRPPPRAERARVSDAHRGPRAREAHRVIIG